MSDKKTEAIYNQQLRKVVSICGKVQGTIVATPVGRSHNFRQREKKNVKTNER